MDKKNEESAYWRCEKRKECSGRLSTLADALWQQPSEHSHPPDPARIAVQRAVSAIKYHAENSEESTSNIIQNCTQDFPLSAAGSLPKKETLARMIRRKRKASDGDDLLHDMCQTTRGEQFLALHDENLDLYVFATSKNLDILARQRHWFCDGTFDSAPMGYQLYTVHVIADGSRTVPVVYCVARRKDRNTYNRIYQFLKDCRQNLSPLTVMIDFEMAAIQSLEHHFPEAEIQGCLFHFGQCLWRNVQRLGLQNWYKEDANNAMTIKSFQALAFVPTHRVTEVFQELMATLDDDTDDVLSDFLTYFEATWIGVVQRGRRRRPLFAISLWNVHSRVVQDLPRTNNSIEGWHHSFDLRVSITHPTIRRLSSKLVKEQASNELLLEQVLACIPQPPAKKKYESVNLRLKDIVSKIDTYQNMIMYLRAIAHNL